MDIDPQKVIEILGKRLAAEMIQGAMREAALMSLQEDKEGRRFAVTRFHAFIHGLKFIEKNDWAWIHAKAAIGILCPAMALMNPPAATRDGTVHPQVMMLILVMLAFGGMVSIVGLFVRGTRIRPLIVGYAIEMAGLIPLIAGPFLLSITYLASAAQGGAGSLVGFAFCYTMSALLLARYIDTLVHHLTASKLHGSELGNEGRT